MGMVQTLAYTCSHPVLFEQKMGAVTSLLGTEVHRTQHESKIPLKIFRKFVWCNVPVDSVIGTVNVNCAPDYDWEKFCLSLQCGNL
jgi:hypothetical protein